MPLCMIKNTAMSERLEFRAIGPEEIADFIRELDERAQAMANPETKYRFQVRLKEVEFQVHRERADACGFNDCVIPIVLR